MRSTPEQRPQYDDEISLVDIAATFIRRRRIFYAVFVIFTLGGLAYALLATETYQYTSLIQVAEKGSGKYIEEPATTIATLENRWLPEQETIFRAETDGKLPFSVSFSNPDNTGLIRFTSEAASDSKREVELVHSNLIDSIKARQNALLEREKQSLQSRINSVERAIETLQGGEDTGAAIAEAFERKVRLESDLEALKPAEVLVVSRQSADKTGPARVKIMVVTLFIAGIMGVLSVFLVQFGGSVRTALKTES
ncbi:Wzz/FepE/Etk N-terminal domain-containing protein [Marinobacter salicampi]|uniref:Wzz/FepE/Etk N-terminal domain-containing protein n=1 Tax=Marinobacter salicampi TaxID=435907 RepID=UPI00140E30CE|nr:Wzz/FepE/Etk N-terminal domain-containing protein [Marinobacter salicampi]